MTSASLHRTGALLAPCTAGEQVEWKQSFQKSNSQFNKGKMVLHSTVNMCLPESLKFVGVSAEV